MPRGGRPPTLPTTEEVARAVAVAAGRETGDLLLTGGQVVDVFGGEVRRADVLVSGRLIAAVGEGLSGARETVELGEAFIVPGLIDGHVHIESALVTPASFAEVVVPRGVTAVVCDPHELANVAGEAGVRWLLDAADDLPLDVWVTIPSCVPSTPLETIGAEFGLPEMTRLTGHPRVVGVAEVMSFPALVAGDDAVLAKVGLAEDNGVPAEGHAPGLSGRDLQAYLAAGVSSDHESTTLREATEKLRAGMYVMVREGSVTRDLAALLPLLDPRHADRVGLVTDDRLPHDLLAEGGVDHAVRAAIAGGVEPVYAVRCASYNHALHYRLGRRGAVAAGYFADLSVMPSMHELRAERVYKDGSLVARGGSLTARAQRLSLADDSALEGTVRLGRLTARSFEVPAPPEGGRARCIVAVPNQIVTRSELVKPRLEDGAVVADPDQDLAKLACVERHGKHGGGAASLVKGFGLRRGALASSVGHDHHNLLVVGVSDGDMLLACRRLEELGGGLVAVADGEVMAELALPLAGLVTDAPLRAVAAALDRLDEAATRLGVTLPAPFMALSFLGLPVVPELKLTDLGLVDVASGALVPPWEPVGA